MGLSSNRFCLNGLAWGHRSGQCTRRSLHKSTLSVGVWLGVGVARVFRAQSASQVSEPSSEKSCKNLETHVESKTRFQRQGPADLQPFRHDEEYLQCRIRCRILYHILYIVYDIRGIYPGASLISFLIVELKNKPCPAAPQVLFELGASFWKILFCKAPRGNLL